MTNEDEIVDDISTKTVPLTYVNYIALGAVVIGAAAGFGAGYTYARKRMQKTFDELVDIEVERTAKLIDDIRRRSERDEKKAEPTEAVEEIPEASDAKAVTLVSSGHEVVNTEEQRKRKVDISSSESVNAVLKNVSAKEKAQKAAAAKERLRREKASEKAKLSVVSNEEKAADELNLQRELAMERSVVAQKWRDVKETALYNFRNKGVDPDESEEARNEFNELFYALLDRAGFEDPRFDYEVEWSKRHYTRPYVISIEEWRENPDDNERIYLAYYPDDDILCDENDKIVERVDDVIGLESLERFGDGSGSHEAVFVRAVRPGIDFEIVLMEGSYSEAVLGVYPDES